MMWFAGLKGLMRSSASAVPDANAEAYAQSVSQTVAQIQVRQNEDTEQNATSCSTETESHRSAFIKTAGRQLQVEGEENDFSLPQVSWGNAFSPDMVTDFAPEEDSLLFVWDDTVDQEEPPLVSVRADPQAVGKLQVCMQDKVIAKVSGPKALDPVDISMIPLSCAQALDLVTK